MNTQGDGSSRAGPSRRAMIRATGAGLVGFGVPAGAAKGQAAGAASPAVGAAPSDGREAAPAPHVAPLNRFPRMVQEHYVRLVREAERAGNEARAALKTKADAERYVASARERVKASFGPFPEKTPLNARVTGVVERDGYEIEKVIFESRPGFLVTANLYVPTNRQGPRPGVVGSCGHSANGKAAGTYQSFAQGLARLGYVCLIFDPVGQGERLQYAGAGRKPTIGAGVSEHLMAGNQQFLVGDFLGSWRAWDALPTGRGGLPGYPSFPTASPRRPSARP